MVTPTLKLYTLGGLSIRLDDQPVARFTTRKVDALLLYLACERREHSREWVADLLWDNVPQARAMGNLRTALVDLNQQLGDYLIVTRQTLMINPDAACWVDATVLSSAASSKTNSTAALRQLETAVDLYRGDFLAGFHLRDATGFEEWQVSEAERLRGLAIASLDRLVQEALERERYARGIDHAQRLLILEPLNEAGHRGLMLLYARTGQRGAALAQYETCVRLLDDELGVEPDAETNALYSSILSQPDQIPPAVPAREAAVHLPIAATPFVERPHELQRIVERIRQPDCRLLTIVGAGGIGKTRLAIRAAAEIAEDYRDGVYFVPLASVQQGELLPVEIANCLNFTFKGDDPQGELEDYLAKREMLLVLDNFEHLADHAGLIANLLGHAPELKVLVTSRAWLKLQEESTLGIDGMDVPTSSSDDADQYGAVQLFEACARRVQPEFSLAGNIDAVIDICRMVEGMPLGIELAAAWLRVIPAAEIARTITPKFLATAVRNVPDRHRSIEALFAYSWQMLPPDVAAMLATLSVFKGVFDREAAASVAGATLESLALLLEHSLIRRADDAYYAMHELLRQFAFERLDDANAARDAHLRYYVTFTANPDSRIHGEQQTKWLERLEREHDNLRAAMSWAIESGLADALDAGLTVGASIWEFWLMRGHITEGRHWLGMLLDATRGMISKARGAATQGAGYLAWIQGDYDKAEALHREGVAIRTAVGDKAGLGGSLSNLGIIAWSRGDFATARDYYEQALAARREANYRLGMASVLNNLSLLMQEQSLFEEAIAYSEQAWALYEELQDLQGMVHILYNMGAMLYDRGDLERARRVQEEALTYAKELGDQRIIGGLLKNLGETLMGLGEIELSRGYLDESLALVSQVSDMQHIALVQRGMAKLALLDGRLNDAETAIDACVGALRQHQAHVYLGQALLTRGDVYRAQGRLEDAEGAYHEALTLLLKSDRPQPIAEALYCMGGLLFERNMSEAAVVLISAADRIAERFHLLFPTKPEQIDRAELAASLPESAFRRAVERGAMMENGEASAYVASLGLRGLLTTS